MMRANLTYAASEPGSEDLAGGSSRTVAWWEPGDRGKTAMWTRWGVAAFAGLPGPALVDCGSRADC